MKYIPVILAGFSVVLCLVLCYFLLATDLFTDRLTGNKRTIMVAVLILYATFRSYRMYKLVKQK